MSSFDTTSVAQQTIDSQIRGVLSNFPQIQMALLFGSVASGSQHQNSDLDIAVTANQALTAQDKIAMIGALAESTGRPIDLVDLKVAGEPLL